MVQSGPSRTLGVTEKVDLRDMLVREHHQRALTELASVSTDLQLADPLTKVLAGPKTRQFRSWALRGELPADAM